MKYIVKFLYVLFLTLTLFSCNGEDDLSSLESQTMTFESFFEKVSSMDIKTNKENVIYVNYEWNRKLH